MLGRIIGGAEELTLDTGVSRAGNVLSIAPLSVTGATGRVVAATATAAASVTTAALEVTTTARVTAASAAPTATTTAGAGSVVIVGRDVVAPVGLASTVILAVGRG